MKTCTPKFTKALILTVKNWDQSRCPTTDKKLNELWYFHHGTLLSNIKAPTTGTYTTLDESVGNYPEGKKPIPKGYILYDY